MQAALPQIALDPPRPPPIDAADPRRIQLRLYRRLVELRDGLLELTPHLSAADLERERERAVVAGRSDDAARAEALGQLLDDALAASQTDQRVEDQAPGWFTLELSGRAEAQWWCTVLHAWREGTRAEAGKDTSVGQQA
jgi:hypothetical protein